MNLSKPMDIYSSRMDIPFDMAAYCRGHKFSIEAVELSRALKVVSTAEIQLAEAQKFVDAAMLRLAQAKSAVESKMSRDST